LPFRAISAAASATVKGARRNETAAMMAGSSVSRCSASASPAASGAKRSRSVSMVDRSIMPAARRYAGHLADHEANLAPIFWGYVRIFWDFLVIELAFSFPRSLILQRQLASFWDCYT
jgi:hypothetical protein